MISSITVSEETASIVTVIIWELRYSPIWSKLFLDITQRKPRRGKRIEPAERNVTIRLHVTAMYEGIIVCVAAKTGYTATFSRVPVGTEGLLYIQGGGSSPMSQIHSNIVQLHSHVKPPRDQSQETLH